MSRHAREQREDHSPAGHGTPSPLDTGTGRDLDRGNQDLCRNGRDPMSASPRTRCRRHGRTARASMRHCRGTPSKHMAPVMSEEPTKAPHSPSSSTRGSRQRVRSSTPAGLSRAVSTRTDPQRPDSRCYSMLSERASPISSPSPAWMPPRMVPSVEMGVSPPNHAGAPRSGPAGPP